MSDRLPQLKADAKAQGWSRWIRSEADERAMPGGCYFDKAAGLRVVKFFAKVLHHSKGEWAGKPFRLLRWERNDVLMPLFGWMRADGSRRYRVAGLWVAKKNGKSEIAAGTGTYLLVADGETGAQVYSAAAARH